MNKNNRLDQACTIRANGFVKYLAMFSLSAFIALAPHFGHAAQCKGEVQSAFFNIPQGKWVKLDLKKEGFSSRTWLHSIEDPSFIKINPKFSRKPAAHYFLYGKKMGSTNLILRGRNDVCTMVALSIGIDTSAVQAKLKELLPNEKNIKVVAAADSLVLTGSVSDATAVDKAASIAKAYLRKSHASGATKKGGKKEATAATSGSVVNMLGVAAPQQVMLEVKIAEVSKTLLDELGMNIDWATSKGSWTASVASDFLFGTLANPNGAGVSLVKSNGNTVALDAEKKDSLVKVLAEPNIMAISGQEGSFLAGGKIFIPVSVDDNTVSLEEKEFGVGLKFFPTVLADGRINIRVAQEVSEFSRVETGYADVEWAQNVIFPVFNMRRAATTVQLYDGQSFAIGGLIKSDTTANIDAFPGLGEIPVLGALFRSTDFQEERTELLFVITPHLVKPLRPDYTLPTDNHITPTRKDLFLNGRLEGVAEKPQPQTQEAPQQPLAVESKSTQAEPAQINGPVGFE